MDIEKEGKEFEVWYRISKYRKLAFSGAYTKQLCFGGWLAARERDEKQITILRTELRVMGDVAAEYDRKFEGFEAKIAELEARLQRYEEALSLSTDALKYPLFTPSTMFDSDKAELLVHRALDYITNHKEK